MEEDRVLEIKWSQDPGTPSLGYRVLFGKQIFQHACYFSDCGRLIVQPESCYSSGALPPDSCSGPGRGAAPFLFVPGVSVITELLIGCPGFHSVFIFLAGSFSE